MKNKTSFSSLLLLLMTSSLGALENNSATDATEIPLEELLQTEYIPASHIANQISNAASAVSIVTAQDIKDYGYRTLSEILSSMRGLHVPQSYTYSFLGGRGYPSNEYAGRIIVLIDGYRADDSMFGQAYLGNDGILDVALIDRVEYVPGGGSAGYGDGALLGAINIITKKGSDISGTQVALGFGSRHGRQQRVSFGEKLDNGANLLISASSFNANGSIEKDGDNDEENKRLFAKYDAESFSFQGAYAKRQINHPTYSAIDSLVYGDENAFALFKYNTDIASALKLSSSFWYGHYIYSSDYLDPEVYRYESENIAQWHGGDAKLIGTWFDNHTISLGVGYRHDYRWQDRGTSFDMIFNDVDSYDSSYQPRKTYSLYAYDDFAISPSLSLNYGVRYEKSNNDVKRILSPRASLIYQPWDESILKLSTGVSNRQATQSEGEWDKPERAKTEELVLEQQLGWQTKLIGSLYRYRISDRISYGNTECIIARGAEVEIEKHWEEGIRLRTSYARQNTKNSNGERLGQSPSHLAKFNLSTPLWNDQLRMSAEAQYTGKYLPYTGSSNYHDAYTVVNLNLLARKIAPNLDINVLAHDVFKKSDKEKTTYLPQSGRTFWLQLEYTFQ
ncbi:TonB-dependent siderophore receptor [Sulfuricurvum sp. RIFOXYD12_FULL_44_77]|uniref:TonB-dependent receptor plug domain-containing protein n=1 Tax=Sulfuricurvum sp. RIFOXYD12_FULL_44_77 TaxID=1802248 RepID=UPI0025DB11E6|nr:TonB-dependent receptor [Sulfuricurvum sp. RIFOXYD12_FULL_44_77]